MTEREQLVADIQRRFNLRNDNGHDHDLTNLDVQIILTELERLQRENDQLRAEVDRLKYGGWISVKERLPEIGDTVLVYYRRGDYRGVDILRYCGRWVTVDWYTQVTHWMPLPEPPKEDGKT